MNETIKKVRVSNMRSNNGNEIANQFQISVSGEGRYFQSYSSVIVHISPSGQVFLDEQKWDYSVTTSKYRNIFLGETTKETEKKIKDGTYKLVDLN